jgi:hypothetical protein
VVEHRLTVTLSTGHDGAEILTVDVDGDNRAVVAPGKGVPLYFEPGLVDASIGHDYTVPTAVPVRVTGIGITYAGDLTITKPFGRHKCRSCR